MGSNYGALYQKIVTSKEVDFDKIKPSAVTDEMRQIIQTSNTTKGKILLGKFFNKSSGNNQRESIAMLTMIQE